MELLEREQDFEQLALLWQRATTGQGRTVLVNGEAGIGKTTLVEQFVRQQCQAARCLWGACDALFTPRPLGPLYDMALQAPDVLSSLLQRETPRPVLFSTFLDELRNSGSPIVVVIEDVHWADEATLDLIKFLGRRISHLPTLLILTYRHDELGRDHPLRVVLGDLPSTAVARLHLAPLSEQAIIQLARQANQAQRSAQELHAITGGNPFFLTEVLASDASDVPLTVREAVLARVARLSPAVRALLELVSVVPTRTERWLLETILDAAPLVLEECLSSGMLSLEGATVAFRHELARLAVESALSPLRKQALHAQVLQSLLTQAVAPSKAARLVHHATGAHDEALITRFAPLAARHAAAQGAHREAAAHYATALAAALALPPEERAALLEGRAYECYLTGQVEDAEAAQLAALRIWRQQERPEQVGHTLRWLSRLDRQLGKPGEAQAYATEAVQVLEALPAGRELAMAYSNKAQLAQIADDNAEAISWGTRALALAEQLGDVATVVHALNTLGTAYVLGQHQHGWELLEQSLQLALEHGFEEHAARAYNNLADCALSECDYRRARGYLEAGIAYCDERDLDFWGTALRSAHVHARFEQGAWEEAAEEAMQLLARYRSPSVSKIFALLVLGWVRLRRGDPGSAPLLEEAHQLALQTRESYQIAPVAAARAEAAWLAGDLERCQSEARVGYDLALAHTDPWALGRLASWLWRAGGLAQPPGPMAEPFALEIAGDWQGAAARWTQIGCPYEQALALSEGGADAQRQAVALFEQLGAQPAAARVRQRMRAQGRTGIPRGPRPTTRANQAGLTSREVEVLRLLAEGLSNAEIAHRLSTSPKTVDHQVSAVLAKLQVHSRLQAITVASVIGLLPPTT
ncbi:MAG TPA: AAA family ATPase [Ktedonobacterales bacterium]|jgi:DNA-binding CsgD family transcriptional regulator